MTTTCHPIDNEIFKNYISILREKDQNFDITVSDANKALDHLEQCDKDVKWNSRQCSVIASWMKRLVLAGQYYRVLDNQMIKLAQDLDCKITNIDKQLYQDNQLVHKFEIWTEKDVEDEVWLLRRELPHYNDYFDRQYMRNKCQHGSHKWS